MSKITADEWKTFALYFAEVAFYELDLLSDDEAEALGYLVKFLQLASLAYTTPAQANAAKVYLQAYLHKYRANHEKWRCKPNHHLAMHLIRHWITIGTPLSMSTFWYVKYSTAMHIRELSLDDYVTAIGVSSG